MKKVFPGSMDQLRQMLQFVREEIAEVDFSNGLGSQVELALEEAIVNIIKHGYVNSKGNIEIQCIHLPEKGIKLKLIDTGIPYNPLLNAPKKEQNALPTPELSGLGIFLIIQIMDDVEYEHKEGCNILTLIKYKS